MSMSISKSSRPYYILLLISLLFIASRATSDASFNGGHINNNEFMTNNNNNQPQMSPNNISTSTSTSSSLSMNTRSWKTRLLFQFLTIHDKKQQQPQQQQRHLKEYSPPSSSSSSSSIVLTDNSDTDNKICRNYLKQFLSGSTDERDQCEGLENAYSASNCQEKENNDNGNGNDDDGGNHIQNKKSPSSSLSFKDDNQKNSTNNDNDDQNNNNNNNNNSNDDDDDDQSIPSIDDFFEEFECCQIISHYYSNQCLYHQRYASLSLLGIVSVLILCSLTKTIIQTLQLHWLPEAGGCILVGAIVNFILHSTLPSYQLDFAINSFNDELFMYILLPPIIFQAALSIDKKQFNKLLFPIMMFAVVGTFYAAIVTGIIVHSCTKWLSNSMTVIPLLDSLIFGALISSVDPVATLSILQQMGVSETNILYVVVFGESILNDGVAIALFDSLKMHLENPHNNIPDDNNIDNNSNMILNDLQQEGGGGNVFHQSMNILQESVQYFLKISVVSVLIGLVIGVLCTIYFWTLRGRQSPVSEVAMFFCFALMAYYISDGIGCSGIISIMTAGFIMDIYVRGYRLSERDGEFELLRSEELPNDVAEHNVQVTNNDDVNAPLPIRRSCPTYSDFRVMFSGIGHISHRAKVHVGFVADVLANLMETSIFAYLGLFLFSNNKWDDVPLILIGIFACVISRIFMIGKISLIVNGVIFANGYIRKLSNRITHRDDTDPVPVHNVQDSNQLQQQPNNNYIDKNMRLILLFSGVRGAVSLALAENIPLYDAVTKTGSQFKPALKAMTNSSIIFTVFFFGASTYFTLKKQRETVRLTGNNDRNGEFEHDLSLQDNTRSSLMTSLLQDSGDNYEQRSLPPWMRSSGGDIEDAE